MVADWNSLISGRWLLPIAEFSVWEIHQVDRNCRTDSIRAMQWHTSYIADHSLCRCVDMWYDRHIVDPEHQLPLICDPYGIYRVRPVLHRDVSVCLDVHFHSAKLMRSMFDVSEGTKQKCMKCIFCGIGGASKNYTNTLTFFNVSR